MLCELQVYTQAHLQVQRHVHFVSALHCKLEQTFCGGKTMLLLQYSSKDQEIAAGAVSRCQSDVAKDQSCHQQLQSHHLWLLPDSMP